MSRELCISMACPTFQKSSELSWLLRKLENLLPGNVSCYQYLRNKKDTSYNSISVIVKDLSMDFVTDCHIHGLEEHQLRSDSCHCRLTQWVDADASQYTWFAEVFIPPDSMSVTKIQSLPPSPGPPGTTFRLGYGYTPLSLTAVTTYASPTKISIPVQITYKLYMADPFPPDFWGYVHGFGYHPEGLVALLWYYNVLKLWQIPLCRTLWDFIHGFSHNCDVFHILLLEHDH